MGFAPVGDLGVLAVVLRHSRATWAQWVDFNASTAVFGRALIEAARHFGGSPRRWVFEEPDCRVLHWDGRGQHFAVLLQAVAEHMGSSLALWHERHRGPATAACEQIVCTRARPSRGALTAGNAALLVWLRQSMRLTPHPQQPSRTVCEVFAEESWLLAPLPPSWATLAPYFAAEGGDDA